MKYLQVFVIIILLFSCSTNINKNIEISIDLPVLSNDNYFDPPYKEAWHNLKNGEYELAMENFQKSTIEDEHLFVGYGFVFLFQGKYNFAIDNFNKSLKINPENILASIGIARIYELIKSEKRAFELYSALLLRHPENKIVKSRYDYLKKEKTKEYIKRAKELNYQKYSEEYIKNLKEALFYSPEMKELNIKIAEYYEKFNKIEKAVKFYELLLAQNSEDINVLNRLAKLYEKIEKIDDAIFIYKKILKITPDNIQISNKINDLKIKFFDNKLPQKFKDIFFKSELNREDLAALIGFYFDKYLNIGNSKIKIITDIGRSYARKEIIKVSTLNIMHIKPDHRFSRRIIINRAKFAKILKRLLNYLRKSGYLLNFKPKSEEEIIKPVDISPVHKDFKLIKELLNADIMQLDKFKRFNQSESISPTDAISSLKLILNSINE